MSGVNKVILLGHLGADPEMRYMPDGTAIANFSIATSESYKDRDGNKQERTEWHRVSLYRRQAEIAGEYLKKGSMVYIEGSIRTRKWTDKEGQERYTTEIVGDRLQMVGSRRDSDGQESANGGSKNGRPASKGSGGGANMDVPPEDFDDEIPFAVAADIARRGLRRVRF
ncbi:single-stranded DNA-binding protein [Acidithiobacillus caldus]